MGLVRSGLGVAVCAAVLLTAACRSSSGNQPSGTTTGVASAAPPVRLAVAEPADGSTVHVSVGSDVDVTLHSTYWRFQPVSPSGVLRGSIPDYRPIHEGPPGLGRGTVSETFVATATGTATITATRNACGEALRCTGDAGRYRLTVVVG